MGRTRKPAADRKKEIVQAALRLAAELGPDRVTTQHLADAVGLTQPAIFRHFPTKADIWVAVGNEIASTMQADRDGLPDSPVERLRALLSRQLDFIERNPSITAILFSRELHAENEGLRRHFAAMMADRRARFADLIGRGIEEGQIHPAVVAEDAAAILLATIQGLAMRWSLENCGFDFVSEGERLIFGLLDSWKPQALRTADKA